MFLRYGNECAELAMELERTLYVRLINEGMANEDRDPLLAIPVEDDPQHARVGEDPQFVQVEDGPQVDFDDLQEFGFANLEDEVFQDYLG